MSFHDTIKAALLGVAALGFTAATAAADQLADVKAAGKIVTATDMHYAPFDMLIDGVYQGMTKDLFDEVAKEIGVEPVYQDVSGARSEGRRGAEGRNRWPSMTRSYEAEPQPG